MFAWFLCKYSWLFITVQLLYLKRSATTQQQIVSCN